MTGNAYAVLLLLLAGWNADRDFIIHCVNRMLDDNEHHSPMDDYKLKFHNLDQKQRFKVLLEQVLNVVQKPLTLLSLSVKTVRKHIGENIHRHLNELEVPVNLHGSLMLDYLDEVESFEKPYKLVPDWA